METRPVEDVAKTWTKGLLNGKDDGNSKDSTTPIADLFLHCTVFFGDISGTRLICYYFCQLPRSLVSRRD